LRDRIKDAYRQALSTDFNGDCQISTGFPNHASQSRTNRMVSWCWSSMCVYITRSISPIISFVATADDTPAEK
jgi:hypothetical protein